MMIFVISEYYFEMYTGHERATYFCYLWLKYHFKPLTSLVVYSTTFREDFRVFV